MVLIVKAIFSVCVHLSVRMLDGLDSAASSSVVCTVVSVYQGYIQMPQRWLMLADVGLNAS